MRTSSPGSSAGMSLVGAIHLKFWDLDDADGRVIAPRRELGSELRLSGFTGSLCSEWAVTSGSTPMRRR